MGRGPDLRLIALRGRGGEREHLQTDHIGVRERDRANGGEGGLHLRLGGLLARVQQRQAHKGRGASGETGVGPEVVVAVLMRRSPEMMVSLLGILKAGGAYLPLDPEYPVERLAFMLEDSGAAQLLTTEELAGEVGPWAKNTICLDTDWPRMEQQPASPPVCPSSADNLAYVIYTAGSTGRPKGVAVAHRSLANLVAWHQREYEVTASDRATQVAAPGFDASVWEIWPYLCAGASVHIPEAEVRMTPRKLVDWLVAEGITLSFLPTPLAEAVLEERWPAECALRALLTGGDRLHRGLLNDYPFRVVNHYGPTENTVVSTAGVVRPASAGDGPPPIGRPIANTQAYILDRRLNPVPVGTPGELYVGGENLARGYLHRPMLTAERFVPHPFSERPGERLYKTGDLARWLPDGRIDFLGRIDQQVKVRGYRIELGEIEAILAAHDSVDQAIVVTRPDPSGQQRLVAYVVSATAEALSVESLREHLRRLLPEYMVPATFVPLDRLPLTAHGKVDRRQLPAPDTTGAAAERPDAPPRTPNEERLAEIWAKVLGVERVGVQDNFFDVGGDSLSAVRMMAETEQVTGVTVPLRLLFQQGTIEKLAEAIDGEQSRTVELPLVEIQGGTQRPPLFVIHPAEGTVLGFVQLARQLGEEQPFYGLQAPGLEGEAEPLRSVEQMAAHYVMAVRKVQRHGPYFLAGWSFGGLVAFEMAQQLIAAGEPVGWLGLFDSFVLDGLGDVPLEMDRALFASGARQYLEQLGLPLPVAEEVLARHEPAQQVEILLSGLAEAGTEFPQAVALQARSLLNLWDLNAASGRAYRPRVYSGEITLFRAGDDELAAAGGGPDPVEQWQHLSARPLVVHRVPGTHTSMMLDPQNVAVLAAELRASLAANQPKPSED